MKRFFIFLVVAIAVVSLGLTIYYFSVDNELIYIKSSFLVVDAGEQIQTEGDNGLLDFKNKSKYTTINFETQDNNILNYNDEGWFLAAKGGETKIIVNTSNRSYSRLVIDVLVCDGSEEFPYLISTEEELRFIGSKDSLTSSVVGENKIERKGSLKASYKLGNDIVLTDSETSEGNWKPMNVFDGVFDGNHYKISNMKIREAVGGNAGFISTLNGKIKNLNLENADIDVDAEYVGMFAGSNNGTIQTSEATGSIKNTSTDKTAYTGGIAGRNLYNNGSKTIANIDRCGFEGSLILAGEHQIGGGVVAYNQSGMISESYFRANPVENNTSNFGGIVGYNSGTYETADIFDCYFYAKSKTDSTREENMAGIVYTNENKHARRNNLITGCYFGGEISFTNKTGDGSSLQSSKSNDYLSKEDFKFPSSFINSKLIKDGDTENNRIRTWNFNTVWTIPNGVDYPILNVYSSVGSTFTSIDITEITGDDVIETAQNLYDVIRENKENGSYKIINDLDFSNFVWGDDAHPIPERFDGIITNETHLVTSEDGTIIEVPYKIQNLKIYADSLNVDGSENTNGNVGLVKKLGSSAIISGLIFDGVVISNRNNASTNSYNYVGVIAGESEGANIYDIKIKDVNVNVKAKAYGTIFGYAASNTKSAIQNIEVGGVDLLNSYFKYAGGLVGVNFADITSNSTSETSAATTKIYNYVHDVKLIANIAGGIVGANAGKISYTTSYHITYKFNKENDSALAQYVYNGENNVYVGGIAGTNGTFEEYGNVSGSIVDVGSNIDIEVVTGNNYKVYLGGVSGLNKGDISRAFVKASEFKVTGSNNVFVGGVVGYNQSRISNSVVDAESKISTSIVPSVGATTPDSTTYLLNTDNCSVVGGIVGYNAPTTDSSYSIYQCATLMTEIKGYYAGGICGISLGKVEYSYCGESSSPAQNGNVSITGYMTGGLSGVIANGYFKNCYTFCRLNSAPHNGNYKNFLSVMTMEVSAMGGFTVVILGKDTFVESCYTVASYNGSGVSYATCGEVPGNQTLGTVKNSAYLNVGSIQITSGTKLTDAQFRGTDGYNAFSKAIGVDNVIFDTTRVENGYPILKDLNIKYYSSNGVSKLPTYH